MMNLQQNRQNNGNNLFEQSDVCLFELSDAGTILYCRTNAGSQLNKTSAEAVGRNFFDEAAPFQNAGELKLRLNRFAKSDSVTERFDFACRIENRIVPAKVMLVRVAERANGELGKTTIVDIRKIQLPNNESS